MISSTAEAREERQVQPGVWAAALGALIGGFVIYSAIAGMGGGLDWDDRLTFDQSGELELEGIGIILGLVAGPLIGAPLGAYVALRLIHARKAGVTAFALILPSALITGLAFRLVPTAPDDPVLAPYFVFGGWFVCALVTRWLMVRRMGDLAW
ncbi:MAG TPA: hypothetical protein VG408_08440 [Actinomycetota bacterium]|nr:hypothetical protein [Actinomycetota bacterium]